LDIAGRPDLIPASRVRFLEHVEARIQGRFGIRQRRLAGRIHVVARVDHHDFFHRHLLARLEVKIDLPHDPSLALDDS